MSVETEHRRLLILRYLQGAPGYTCNASMLLDILRNSAISSSYDQIAGALAWLEEQELVKLTNLDSTTIATMTARGSEVASGAVIMPGVKRPSPQG